MSPVNRLPARWGVIAMAAALLTGACTAAEPTTPAPFASPQAGRSSSTPAPSPATPSSGSPSPTRTVEPNDQPARATLPRGGREVFPRYRLVGYAGLTGSPTLGRLGTGPLDQRVSELEMRAKPYGKGREVLPVLEIITTIVHASPGRDGMYRSRLPDEQIATYLKAARRHHALLLLNIQPGRSKFLAEARAYERWLKEPDVGLALDPEWAMGPGQRPGGVFGHTSGAVLDDVSTYLSDIVKADDLPEKVLVYHQLAPGIVRSEKDVHDHQGVAVVKTVDGIGVPGAKIDTYRRVNQTTPDFVHAGFKLFYDEDRKPGPLMSPKDVLALDPRPEYVVYE